jgi:hypothetical protein
MPTKRARKRECRTKSARTFLFVRERAETHRGREVRRYYGCTREGTAAKDYRDEVLVRITKRQYEAHRHRVWLRERGQAHERKLKSDGSKVAVKGAGHCWPLKSEAVAVHPSQVAEMNEYNRSHGVNVTYDPKWGTAIIPDRGAYKKFQKLHKIHERNSYG